MKKRLAAAAIFFGALSGMQAPAPNRADIAKLPAFPKAAQ
jgi:hypothetical protein